MVNNQRRYPFLAACGLNCGLCPRFHTDGNSQCPGCGGEGFLTKRPSCGIISCGRRHGGIDCCLCDEYPCKRYEGADQADSFITHQNMRRNFEKTKEFGLAACQAELEEKMDILRGLLEHYNDGRRKSFFCLAVNRMELRDVRRVLEQIEAAAAPERTIKERSAAAVGLFQAMAEKRGVLLKRRKKGDLAASAPGPANQTGG